MKRTNMRFPNLRRCLVVVLVFPIFILLLLVNRIFIALDYLIVPFFVFQRIEKPVFIVGPPRSGTTYLFHSLAFQSNDFTCIKLWEIVLAPSVIQKIIWRGIIEFDRFIGGPMKWFALKIENNLIGDLKTIHPISINMPEEDEAVLLWDLSSIYLNFFYPDSHFFDDYLLFDKNLSERRKQKIMRSYRNYIRRHNFVFNRKGKKQFLSKNPLMMCKLESLHYVFPDAIILNTNRCPQVTIPSTIALNNKLYSLFTSRRSDEILDRRTKDVLMKWFIMSQEALRSDYEGQFLEIDFNRLIQKDKEVQREIAELIGRDLEEFLLPREAKTLDHKSNNKYEPLSEEELKEVLSELPFMKKYCQ